MAYKTIKKSAASLTGLVFSILIVLGIFSAMFLYWQANAESAGVTIDSKYSETYANLTSAQDDLDNNVQAIKDNYESMKEAETAFQVAWNGLKGLGNTMKLPISFLTTALATYTAFDYSLDYIPTWVKTLVIIGLTAFIVFLLLSVLRGRS